MTIKGQIGEKGSYVPPEANLEKSEISNEAVDHLLYLRGKRPGDLEYKGDTNEEEIEEYLYLTKDKIDELLEMEGLKNLEELEQKQKFKSGFAAALYLDAKEIFGEEAEVLLTTQRERALRSFDFVVLLPIGESFVPLSICATNNINFQPIQKRIELYGRAAKLQKTKLSKKGAEIRFLKSEKYELEGDIEGVIPLLVGLMPRNANLYMEKTSELKSNEKSKELASKRIRSFTDDIANIEGLKDALESDDFLSADQVKNRMELFVNNYERRSKELEEKIENFDKSDPHQSFEASFYNDEKEALENALKQFYKFYQTMPLDEDLNKTVTTAKDKLKKAAKFLKDKKTDLRSEFKDIPGRIEGQKNAPGRLAIQKAILEEVRYQLIMFRELMHKDIKGFVLNQFEIEDAIEYIDQQLEEKGKRSVTPLKDDLVEHIQDAVRGFVT